MKSALRLGLLSVVRLFVGAHADWQGCVPQLRQRIYFADHTSHFDTLVIVAALPAELRAETHPVAALDYWGASALRRFIAVECLNAVLIDRSEGTRGADGTVGRFRSGLYNLAQRFPQAELVPVYLDNPRRVMPRGSFLIVPCACHRELPHHITRMRKSQFNNYYSNNDRSIPVGDPRIFELPCQFPAAPSIRPESCVQGID